MTEHTQKDGFEDAFHAFTVVGDPVVYVIGDKTSKHLVKGVVRSVYSVKEYYRDKLVIEIECREDNHGFNRNIPRISKLNHGERIMNLSAVFKPSMN